MGGALGDDRERGKQQTMLSESRCREGKESSSIRPLPQRRPRTRRLKYRVGERGTFAGHKDSTSGEGEEQ